MKQIIKTLGTNFYMLRHQGTIFREFMNNKESYVQHVFHMLVAFTFITKIKN
jgi:hypothetical protein